MWGNIMRSAAHRGRLVLVFRFMAQCAEEYACSLPAATATGSEPLPPQKETKRKATWTRPPLYAVTVPNKQKCQPNPNKTLYA